MKKLASPKKNKSIKRIYIVLYDQEEFLGYERNVPVKAFKTKKSAELYANSRNFEFQSVCMFDEEDYETYVLENQYSDYVVSIGDLRDAQAYVKEEIFRSERNKITPNIWGIIENIKPFKVVPIEYINDIKGL
jgi:hypothetical protein